MVAAKIQTERSTPIPVKTMRTTVPVVPACTVMSKKTLQMIKDWISKLTMPNEKRIFVSTHFISL